MTRRNLEIYRGDSYPFTVTITNDGTAIDATGYQFRMTAKYDITDSDNSAVFILTSPGYINTTSASSGIISVTIPPSATSGLQTGQKYRLIYDIQMYNDSVTVYTICSGILTVNPDVSIGTP